MTVTELILKGLNRFAPVRGAAQVLLAGAVRRSRTRRVLNWLYDRLSFAERRSVHALSAKIFRTRPAGSQDGTWSVDFAGRRLEVPLLADELWLDWDTAVSILGNDVEVKQTYEFLVTCAFQASGRVLPSRRAGSPPQITPSSF
jgi:hypothetical protein